MSDDLFACLFIFGFPLFLLLGTIGIWIGLKERKKKLAEWSTSWPQIGQNLGLTFREEGKKKPLVLAGQVQGVHVEATLEMREAARRVEPHVVIRVAHAQPLPVPFELTQPLTSLFSSKEDRAYTGDTAFDHVFCIQSSTPDAAVALWGPDARRHLLELHGDDITLTANAQEITFTLLDLDLAFSSLEKTILDLVRLAKILQGAAYHAS